MAMKISNFGPKSVSKPGSAPRLNQAQSAMTRGPERLRSAGSMKGQARVGKGVGLGSDLNHSRRYISRMSNNAAGVNGNSWTIVSVPYLYFSPATVDGMYQTVTMVEGVKKTSRFGWQGGSYTGLAGTFRRLVVNNPSEYSVWDASGKQWVFYGPGTVLQLRGKLKRWVEPTGRATVATYNVQNRLVSIEQSDPGSSDKAGLYYNIVESGPQQGRLLSVEKRQFVGGVVKPIMRANFEYYNGSEPHGNANDLKTSSVQVFNSQNQNWDKTKTTYYRYYTSDSSVGFKHGLKAEVGPTAYKRMVAAGTPPETASETSISTYATKQFKYDTQRRISESKLNGGALNNTFEQTMSDEAPGRNWWRKNLRTRSDGSQITTYSNKINQTVLRILKKGSAQWVDYYEYNSASKQTLHAAPDAIASVTEPSGPSSNFTVTLRTNAGLIETQTYYPSSGGGAGSAPNRPWFNSVQQGTAGTPVKLRESEYVTRTAGTETIYKVSKETVYRNSASGGSSPSTTQFSYEWESGTLRMIQRTTMLPIVPLGENGTGVQYQRVERFDSFGNVEWLKDETGVLTYQTFDSVTGALRQRIVDVDTIRMEPSVIPPGWVTPAGAGLHMVYDFQADSQGRNILALGPPHQALINGSSQEVRSAGYTVFLDSRHQIHKAQGYLVQEAARTLGTVSIQQFDANGRLTDEVSASHHGADRIDASDTYPQSKWTRWQKSFFNDKSQITKQWGYFNIPASDREIDQNPVEGFKNVNYVESQFGFDELDRPNRVVAPGETITRTVYDTRDLVVSTWIGTNDAGATDSDPSGGGSDPANNMVAVVFNEYDNGQPGGAGNLTKETRPADADPVHDRVENFVYDFRRRRIQSSVNDGVRLLLSTAVYDNVDNPVEDTSYHTSVSNSNRTFHMTRAYDSLNRRYRTSNFGVDPGTGALGNALVEDRWFDALGNVIKVVPMGTQLYTKTQFDSVNRIAASYLAYPSSGGLSGNSNSVANDIVLEQTTYSYDQANSLVQTSMSQRFEDATGNGPLQGPSGAQPRARISYGANWYDPIARLRASANYGTNGGAACTRPEAPPQSSDLILVSRTDYADSGEANQSVAPDGTVTRWVSDRLGRRIKLIENFKEGVGESDTGANRTTEYHYTPDSLLEKLVLRNISTGDQVTRWEYGTTLENSGVARNDLVRRKVFPESA